MFSICTASDSRENDYAEGFINYWEHVVDFANGHDDYLKGITVSSSQTVLFKPFSRGDNVDDVKGTGLGLTVVKRAADLLDAQIDLLETRQGTCFRLTLPHALAKYVSDPVSN
jgi:K+-sensing histidine kinase KdpD